MANRTTIGADTKITASIVSIADASNPPVVLQQNYLLQVDIGAVQTFITYDDIRGGLFTVGAIVQIPALGGTTNSVDLRGGTITVEIEDQGGGNIANVTCNQILATMGANPWQALGLNRRGFLGMGNLDIMNVDPQENVGRTAARLCGGLLDTGLAESEISCKRNTNSHQLETAIHQNRLGRLRWQIEQLLELTQG